MRNPTYAFYLLFHPPMPGARTGHVGLLITDGTPYTLDIDPAHIKRYFSMYHDLTPSEVRKISHFGRFKGLASYVVDDYYADVIMRGQSWVRLIDRMESEDEKVSKLVATLPTDPKIRTEYLERGQFAQALRLPDTLNFDALCAELDRIKNNATWAMFSPLSVTQPSNNCCTAIWSALEKGGINDHPQSITAYIEQSLLALSIPTKLALWAVYFAFVHAALSTDRSSQNSAPMVVAASLLLLLVKFMQCVYNGVLYANDMKSMAKHPETVSIALHSAITGGSMMINALGSPFNEDACRSVFLFPVALFRRLKAIPGVSVVNEESKEAQQTALTATVAHP